MTNAFLSRAFLSLVVLAPIACGGSTVEAPAEPGADTSVSGDSSSESGGDSVVDGADDTTLSDGTSTDAPGDAPRDGLADAPKPCATEATRPLCTACCGDRHPDGMKTFQAALIGCACTPSVCGTVCAATACATPPKKADDVCGACLAASLAPAGDGGTAGACLGPVTSACSGSAKCKEYVACLNSCPKAGG